MNDTLSLRAKALAIFVDGQECSRVVRDAIEWYHSSLSVIAERTREADRARSALNDHIDGLTREVYRLRAELKNK